ncbi:MAG: 16S rRNA (uracil(1498)-N(3))-methyltransferase [Candidatus Omnitrophica bacterium]|nr:16S rRNA (uracil(1498)-N(3))-methyltransferase [Candidatus Omnitrophota bacterium]
MRFYVSPESIFPEKGLIEIRDKSEIHHIRDVMRLGNGVAVAIFDGKGKEYIGGIKGIERDRVIIEIKETKALSADTSIDITLYQAISKKNMDFIIEKAVELGVTTIVPVITDRTIPQIKDKKIDRWKRIAMAASKQCGRIRLPDILDAMRFNDALTASKKTDLKLFAALDKDATPLSAVLKEAKPNSIAVFIGPEGDFSEQEIHVAKQEGCRVCSLGPFVLRVETAAIYILSALVYKYTA